MRVAGEHEVDKRATGVGDDVVGVVRFVCHEQDGAVRFGGDGEIEVGMAGAGVFDAAEPEASSPAFDRKVLIDENRRAVGDQGMGDHRGTEGDVVVAQDGVAERSGDSSKDLGTAVNSVATGDKAESSAGNEVAGEENEVGGQGIDVVDDALQEEGLGVFVEVDVADLDNAVTVKGSRQICDSDGALNDVDLVAGDFARVESESGGCGSSPDEEVAAGEAGGLARGGAGHSS